MKIQMYPSQNEFGEYYDDQSSDDDFDQDFWLDFLHNQEMEGDHEAETPYGHATPYYYDESDYDLRDHPFSYQREEYDPYSYLHHSQGPIHHGHDEYLGVERAHDHLHGLDLQHRLAEAHRVRSEYMETGATSHHGVPLTHDSYGFYPDHETLADRHDLDEQDRLAHDMFKHDYQSTHDFDPTFYERIVAPKLDDHYYHQAPEGVHGHLNDHMLQ